MLNAIIDAGGTTALVSRLNADELTSHYIEPPLLISCHVAEARGNIVGFQALEWCDPDWTGPGKLPSNWAVIATFVSADVRGHGVGRSLFELSRVAARRAQVHTIDATIRADNTLGLAYYSGIGFQDYDRIENVPLDDGTLVDRVRKKFVL